MIVYKDIFTGSELFTDSYKVKLVDGCLYEIDCKNMSYKLNDDSATAGCAFNPSAEGDDEQAADLSECVTRINVVHECRMVDQQLDKKSYQQHLKTYFAQIRKYLTKNNPERLEGFLSEAKPVAAKLIKKIKDCDFYAGETPFGPDPEDKEKMLEGMVVLCDYREDGVTPYLTFWKDGLIEEKN